MEFRIIRKFYSQAQANLYYIQLEKAGIRCFLSNENISTILPLSDGGLMLNVAEDQIAEAHDIMKKIDLAQEEYKKNEDFRDATKDDIFYEQQVQEKEEWLKSGWINEDIVKNILFLLFILVILGIVINFFFPFFR